MNDSGNDSYQGGRSGSQSTGSTVVDAIEYSRGRRDAAGGQGSGMLVGIVVLSPFICLTYPFVGLLTVGAALLVPRVAPLAGIKTGSGVLIVVTLVAIVAAFLGGLAAWLLVSALDRRNWRPPMTPASFRAEVHGGFPSWVIQRSGRQSSPLLGKWSPRSQRTKWGYLGGCPAKGDACITSTVP